MKSPEERKTRPVPTRMTQAQYEKIKQQADERNMSVSAFMVFSSEHADATLTPQKIAQLHDFATRISEACTKIDPQLARELREGADGLWQLL
jgi:uncharacterized protein (DUF1778 family)